MTTQDKSSRNTIKIDLTVGILGCSGFIGSGLMSSARNLDINVEGISRRTPATCADNQSDRKVTIGDVNDKETLRKFFRSVNIVVDCASSLKPSGSTGTNYLSEAMLLDSRLYLAAAEGIAKYIYVSSGGALYPASTEKVSEHMPLRPSSKYGLTKQLCEDIIDFHARNGSINVLSARTSNPYGYHHISRFHGFINILARNMINNKTTTVYGDPKMIQKDYIYIDDGSRALLNLAVKDTLGHSAVNVGFGSTHSLSEIISLVSSELNMEPRIEQGIAMNHDKQQFCLDTSLLYSLTGFKPRYSLIEGIRQTIRWETLTTTD